MIPELNISYAAAGTNGSAMSQMTLVSENNSNSICFKTDMFTFNIVLRDVVELREFFDLLSMKDRKNIHFCSLDIDDRNYSGMRKISWRMNCLAVSLGGIRIELDTFAVSTLLATAKTLRSRIG